MILLLLACTPEPVSESCAECGGECQADSFPETTRDHLPEPLDYDDAPPTNGDHADCWTAWGEHTEEVPDERWVHNLEHGGVVFLYNCPDGCADDLAALSAWTATLPAGRWVLSPYSLMDSRFAAVAWRNRLLLGCLDLDAFQTFYDDHVGHAPEDATSDPSKGCM